MSEKLIELIKNAGVVGAGGAGFPTHIKLSSGIEAEYMIVNGAECEPLIEADINLLKMYTGKILSGANTLVDELGFKKAYICVKRKHSSVVEKLASTIKSKNTELFLLDDFYPAGDEHVLVYETTKRIVPEGGLPLNVGCVVLNVETLFNVCNAIEGIPVTDTYLTIKGEVPNPVTLRLPVGTRISDALKIAGLECMEGKKVIEGGPMMGKLVDNLDIPVIKTTKALIVLDSKHRLVSMKSTDISSIVRRSRLACAQCTMCTYSCPRKLLGHDLNPHKIMRTVNYSIESRDCCKSAVLCSECGLCEHVCPMGLSPKAVNAALKKEMFRLGFKYPVSNKSYFASPVRNLRKTPSKSLIRKLDLKKFDNHTPFLSDYIIPKTVFIPLKQHAGALAKPVASPGQKVKRGDLIADIPEGSLIGARVHASVSGTLIEIRDFIAIEAEGETL